MSATTSIDDQLTRLDEDIRKLKVEFEIYFNGGTKKPPYDMKYRTDSLVKRLYDARNMTFGQRFKYNSLVARYNVYKELWRRTVKNLEEGSREAIRDVSPLLPRVHEPEPEFSTSTVRCSDPSAEPDKVRELYTALVTAKRSCGEPTDEVPFDRFEKIIEAQVKQIRTKLHCEAIEFTVEVADGTVKFRAKAGS
mgnify:CR=1 FL=1